MSRITRHLPEECYYSDVMRSVDGIVYHFISAKNTKPDDPFSIDEIIKILTDYKFSYHYLIDRDGAVYELIPGLHKGKHAGKSRMNGRDWCNSFTIGIAFAGGTDWPYTDEQIASGTLLSAQLMTEHRFTDEWVRGHDYVRSEWNHAHPDDKGAVKVDPGPHFPWADVTEALKGASFFVANMS